jgi:hypothetical protein
MPTRSVQKQQPAKFREMDCALERNELESAFNRAFKKVAKTPPPPKRLNLNPSGPPS